jgi:hypothetical protein
VAENMDTGSRPSTSSVAGQHCAFDARGRDRFIVGRDVANKYGSVRRRGPLFTQISCNRRSRCGRQGQSISPSALGADKVDRAIGPVDVVKPVEIARRSPKRRRPPIRSREHLWQ